MSQLPIDIWWKIMKIVWKDYRLFTSILRYKRQKCRVLSTMHLNIEHIGYGFLSNDLYMMRCLCKTTKRMVDKYSKRYVLNDHYYLFFPYEKWLSMK